MSEENQFIKLNLSTSGPIQPPQKQQSYTVSQRKLKKMTQDFLFSPPSQQEIQDKIGKMRQRLASEDHRQPIQQTQQLHKQIQHLNLTQPNNLSSINIEKVNHLNSLPAARIVGRKTEKQSIATDFIEKTEKSRSLKSSFRPDYFKYEQIIRDKYKYPLKYKIICEQMGYDEEKVYKLKATEIERIQEEYIKNKGMEYLRENSLQAKVTQFNAKNRIKTEETKNFKRSKSQKFSHPRNYVHQIFGTIVEEKAKAKALNASKPKSQSQKNIRLKQLTDQQEMLGKLVFTRVKKHLKEQQKGVDYFKRVHTEEAIDDALIDFLRTKIKKAEVALK